LASAIAHPFAALALVPYFRRFGIGVGLGLVGAACTIVPDIDVLGFREGVPYASLFGHRGFTHSIFFSVLLAALLTIVSRPAFPRTSALASFAFLFACTVSHGLLDALTDGGLGVAFFSPFSNQRYFFPWRPICVSPLSVAQFISGRGSRVLASELQWVMLPSLGLFLLGWLIRSKPVRTA